MKAIYAKRAIKTIDGMDRPTKQRIKNAVERIPQGDIRSLAGSDNLYRLRIGGWRIVFCYLKDDLILIEKIAPRGDVYKGGLL